MHGLSLQFPIVWEKAGKPIKWEKPEKLVCEKILQNPSYVEKLGNCYLYFSHSMGAFFPLDSHFTVQYGKCMDFSINFSYHGKMQRNPSNWESLGNWYQFFPKIMDTFLPLGSHLMVYFTTREMHKFSYQFLTARENAAKSTLWTLRSFYHSIIACSCSKIWWLLKRANRKKRIR